MLFQFVYAASVPVRFVTELDLGRRSSGTLYVPLTLTSATPARRKVLAYPTTDAVLTPIPTEIQDLAGNEVLDPGHLPMVPAIPGMEPPVLGVNPPEPVLEPEPPEKPASLSDDSKAPLVRVGGRVVPAQIVFQQPPIYPENARRARVQEPSCSTRLSALKAFCRTFEL